MSFAFYLVQILVITNVLRLVHPDGGGWPPAQAALVIAGFFAGCLFCSWPLFQFVEKPMVKVLGPRRRPRPSEPSPLEAPAGSAGRRFG
ncbi:hypothetical protein [Dactylosporangium sp. CA-139066]|uniref:hypothetical protein n=1 Tax=Dactylosporangium sp. CA-139066 TaxID=3239930 RepID=UPI003D903C2E